MKSARELAVSSIIEVAAELVRGDGVPDYGEMTAGEVNDLRAKMLAQGKRLKLAFDLVRN